MVANSGDVLDTMIGGDAPSGNTQEAGQILEQAMTMDSEGDRDGAIQMLRKAAQANGCAEVIFRLAYLLDLGGEEDEAVGYYCLLYTSDAADE